METVTDVRQYKLFALIMRKRENNKMKQYGENHISHTWKANNYFIITTIILTFTTDFDTRMIRSQFTNMFTSTSSSQMQITLIAQSNYKHR